MQPHAAMHGMWVLFSKLWVFVINKLLSISPVECLMFCVCDHVTIPIVTVIWEFLPYQMADQEMIKTIGKY